MSAFLSSWVIHCAVQLYNKILLPWIITPGETSSQWLVILDCFIYENFESKREFVVYVQWPAAHSARGCDSIIAEGPNEWWAMVHAMIMQIHLLSTDQFLTFANKTKRYLWILFSTLCVCSGMRHTLSQTSLWRHCCYYSTSSSASKKSKTKQNKIRFCRATKPISLLETGSDFALSLDWERWPARLSDGKRKQKKSSGRSGR